MLQALIGPVTGLLDKFVEDKDQKNALAHEIATLAEKQAHEAAMAQLEVNKAEAQHRSIFVSGWRPSWVGRVGSRLRTTLSLLHLFYLEYRSLVIKYLHSLSSTWGR